MEMPGLATWDLLMDSYPEGFSSHETTNVFPMESLKPPISLQGIPGAFHGSFLPYAADHMLDSQTFDTSPGFSYSTCRPDIAKWREDISPGATTPEEDFFLSSEFQELPESDAWELKDTASVHSVDSAYQSQTGASRPGTTMPQGYHMQVSQDSRVSMDNQFMESSVYSPSMGSDNMPGFQSHQEMTQINLPPAAGEGAFEYANFAMGQAYPQHTAATALSNSAVPMMHPGFSFTPVASIAGAYPYSYQPAMYDAQESSMLLPTSTSPQQISQGLNVDSSFPSAAVPNSPFTASQDSPRLSTNETNMDSLVRSPTVITTQFHHPAGFEQQQQQTSKIRAGQEQPIPSLQAFPAPEDDESELSGEDADRARQMESRVARSHPLYQASPGPDGQYRCPFANECSHKPTNLKCNYDKYIDSHIKPFRCDKEGCENTPFSSTACLLRHEREAHGMHGHGSRPHTCYFRGCERAVEGHGFPRRYNLLDHMKRVHDYVEKNEKLKKGGPTLQGQASASGIRKSASRKQKPAAIKGVAKRQKVSKPKPDPQLERQLQRLRLEEEFSRKKESIITALTKLAGPNDLAENTELADEFSRLRDISAKFKEVGG